MEFRTKVDVTPFGFGVNHRSQILSVGSCFAENIGKKLEYFRFKSDVNPCGIVYNPLSVSHTLQLLLEGRLFRTEDLIRHEGKWVSLYHHGSFSAEDSGLCLKNINTRLGLSAALLPKTDVLLLTFGTSWVYRYRENGIIAANCHKLPAAKFERFRLTVEEIVQEYQELIPRLQAHCPGVKIIFTVSPVRHWKDGAHGNQLSKAVLLLAVEELVREFGSVYYFPSYELVLDELRDYRFYAADMLHPSPQAVDYIWEKFGEAFFSADTFALMKRIDKVNRGLLHRPFSPESEAYRRFYAALEKEINILETDYGIQFCSSGSEVS